MHIQWGNQNSTLPGQRNAHNDPLEWNRQHIKRTYHQGKEKPTSWTHRSSNLYSQMEVLSISKCWWWKGHFAWYIMTRIGQFSGVLKMDPFPYKVSVFGTYMTIIGPLKWRINDTGFLISSCQPTRLKIFINHCQIRNLMYFKQQFVVNKIS